MKEHYEYSIFGRLSLINILPRERIHRWHLDQESMFSGTLTSLVGLMSFHVLCVGVHTKFNILHGNKNKEHIILMKNTILFKELFF